MIKLTTDLRETAIAIAQEAGQAIMQVYADGFEVQIKDDDSPVTAADLAANQVIELGLRQLTPDLPILSEESAQVGWEQRRHWGAYWLVDPLDGTREFVKRNGEFSVNIALIYQGAPAFGVVLAPVTGIVWHAMRGELAYRRQGLHDTVLRTRTCGHRPAARCRQPLAPFAGNRGAAGAHGPHRDHRAGLVAEVLPDRRRRPGCLPAARPDL